MFLVDCAGFNAYVLWKGPGKASRRLFLNNLAEKLMAPLQSTRQQLDGNHWLNKMFLQISTLFNNICKKFLVKIPLLSIIVLSQSMENLVTLHLEIFKPVQTVIKSFVKTMDLK